MYSVNKHRLLVDSIYVSIESTLNCMITANGNHEIASINIKQI